MWKYLKILNILEVIHHHCQILGTRGPGVNQYHISAESVSCDYDVTFTGRNETPPPAVSSISASLCLSSSVLVTTAGRRGFHNPTSPCSL